MFGLKNKVGLLSLVPLLACSAVNAELLSLMNGRSANLQTAPQISADAGIVIADDYLYIGGRVNYKVAPNVLAFGDLGQAELNDVDGLTIGGGVFYQINGLFANVDTAVKASYHFGELEENNFEADINAFAFQFITSGNQLGQSNLSWYTNIGVHFVEVENSDDTELGFGGGIFAPTSFGEFFVGINSIDEIMLGGGARFNF